MTEYSQLNFCEVETSKSSIPQKKIHVIHCAEQGAFKITISSRDIEKRIEELQKGNPHELKSYISFHGSNDTKKTILDDCKQYSLHGDWLQDTEEVRQYLNSQLNYLAN